MNDTKLCPFCGEEIKSIAIKCRFCGERLDGPGTPAPPGSVPASGGTAVPGMVGLGVQAGAGSRLGAYFLEEVIGDGGMGTVYSARHERLGHQVAIKILASNLSRDPQLVARFEGEARLQANINHPNIVAVQDFIIEGDICAFVMEYVRGRTLEDVIRFETGPIPFPRCFQIFVPVLNALGHAHEQGIVHRDIKPSNIMIAEVAGEEVVKVADFGIAKALGGAQRTATGTKMGTLHYMSPEQCRGSKDIDHRADIYSLGVTLYEMATGRVPFDLESEFELMRAHIEEPPLRPSEHYPGVFPSFERAILTAMSKNREERYSGAAEFKRALEEIAMGLASGPTDALYSSPAHMPLTQVVASPMARGLPSSVAHREPPLRVRRSPWLLALIAILAFGVVGGAAAAFWLRGVADDGQDPDPLTNAARTTEPTVNASIPAGWIRIEPGTFIMGSPTGEEGHTADETQHRVSITRPFLLMESEVTQANFKDVMDRNPSYFVSCGRGCPVEQVSWWDAVAYVNALSRREGLPECYELIRCRGVPGGGCTQYQSDRGGCFEGYQCADVRFAGLNCRGYRLPTEAEWEYAARAGSTGVRYGPLGDIGWYESNSRSTPHSIRRRRPNTWGLHDMLGNVAEWNHDWFRTNLGLSAVTDPAPWSSPAQYRVLRGGSWYLPASSTRVASRLHVPPNIRSIFVGFRAARSIH